MSAARWPLQQILNYKYSARYKEFLWFYFVFYTETSDLIVYANLLDQTVLTCQIVTHINMNPTEKFEGVEPVLK